MADTQGSVLPTITETSQGPSEKSTTPKMRGYHKGLEVVASLDAVASSGAIVSHILATTSSCFQQCKALADALARPTSKR